MITEERLTEILDSKFEKLRTELTSSFHKDIVKEVNKLTASISTIRGTATNALKKAKSCEERIVLLESAESPDVSDLKTKIAALEAEERPDIASLNRQSEDIDILKSDCADLKDAIAKCNALVKQQEEEIEDLRNRSMRSTLVFKGLAVGEKEITWDDTESNLLETIRKVDCLIPDDAIERCHRGFQKHDQVPEIVAKFHSWKDADRVKQLFAEKNRKDKNFRVFCNQKYGPLTTARRNMAMLERKKLIGDGNAAKAYVAYPAKLMIAKQKKDKKYSLHTDFSNQEVIQKKNNGNVQTKHA